MTATYEAIATTTLGSNTTEITFSSISGTFTDLVLVCVLRNTTVNWASPRLRFNSDSGTNYSNTFITGNGSTASSGRAFNDDGIALGNTDNSNFGVVTASIMNYSNTTTNKTVISRIGTATTTVQAYVGLWRNTAAITSLTVNAQVNQFATGSTFTLYGIKAE